MEGFDKYSGAIEIDELFERVDNMDLTSAFYIEADLTHNRVISIGGDSVASSGHREWSVDGLMFALTERFMLGETRERARSVASRGVLINAFYRGIRRMKFEMKFSLDGKNEDRWVSVFFGMRDDCEAIKLYAIIENITSQKIARQELLQKVQRDGMTGLYNRDTGENMFADRLIEYAGNRCSMLLVDIDDLKSVNDRLGHAVGDEAIRKVGNILTDHFSDNDIICRMGGDEFAVFSCCIPSEEQQKGSVLKLLRKLSAVTVGDGECVTCSMGAVFGNGGVDSFEELYRKADKALYLVKRNGKNNFTIYNYGMEDENYQFSGYETSEVHKKEFSRDELMRFVYALTKFYSVVAVLNPVRNRMSYYESEGHHYNGLPESGSAEAFKRALTESLHTDDRKDFIPSWWEPGKEHRTVICRQRGDDGVYRRVSITLFSTWNSEGEPLEILTVRLEK